jgi:CelD/BcsL family acetyltransferase involved in cellulose biosynthesis
MISTPASPGLSITCVTDLSELAPFANQWNRLAADVPFRQWEWVESWWRHYCRPGMSPYVLLVRTAAGELVGVLPCYLSTGPLSQRTIRFMGSGEICSDYLTLLAEAGMEQAVAEAVAHRLSEEAADDWALLELDGVAQGEPAVQHLVDWLRQRGHRIHIRQRTNGWRLKLPGGWEEYLAKVSKGRRVRIRQIVKRQLETGKVVSRLAITTDEFERGWKIFCDLHQRRRQSLGEKGCFASERFTAFHEEVSRRFFETGKLRLHWVELEGIPVAVDYAFVGGETIFCYQSGVDPRHLGAQPGWLDWTASIRRAISQGFRGFDFMRGDEPYKATFRAEPIPLTEIRIVSRRPVAVLRDQLWHAGRNCKAAINGARDCVRNWFPAGNPKPEVESDSEPAAAIAGGVDA